MWISRFMDSSEKNFSTRLIQEEDREALLPMLLDYLDQDFKKGSVVLPVEDNVEVLWSMALAASQAGFPSLSALSEDTVVGFLIWTPVVSLFTFEGTLLQDLGCYVKQELRGQRVSSLLRKAAKAMAKDLGIDAVLGTMYGIDPPYVQPTDSREGSADSIGFFRTGVCGKMKIVR